MLSRAVDPNDPTVLQIIREHGQDDLEPIVEQLAKRGLIDEDLRTSALIQLGGLAEIDLDESPPSGTSRVGSPTAFAEGGWVPWRVNEHGVVVATGRVPSKREAAAIDHELQGMLGGVVIATRAQVRAAIQRLYRTELADVAAQGFHQAKPQLSAKPGLSTWQIVIPAILVAVIGLAAWWRLDATFLVLWVLTWVGIGSNALIKLVAGFMTLRSRNRRRRRVAPGHSVEQAELPLYTILVPLFHEGNIAARIVRNLSGMDYPPERLQIILIVEQHDNVTRSAIESLQLPSNFEVLVVPPGQPQTKPRACNYALPFATGELVVIYDAEDEPETDQLRKAAAAFRGPNSESLACVQARLHYYNARTNLLTSLFALEYAYWFDAMLPGFQEMKLPIPLGGTSNHFRTSVLRDLGGWDAYNVTEDADLGMRIGAANLRTEVLDSTTWEEACGRIVPWIRQRTRWIKGYIVTSAVYTRDPVRLVREAGMRTAFSVFGLVLSTPVAFLLYPLLIALTILQMAGFMPHIAVPWVLLLLSQGISALTFALVIGGSAAAGALRYGGALPFVALLSPLYWCLHSFAAWRALWQSVRAPHRWEKTPHGLTG